MIVDSHCHLDDESFDSDLSQVVANALNNGISHIVIPGADPASLAKSVEISHRFENVYFAVGVHPDECQKYDEEFLKSYINDPKCVAVGECGLDYYRLKDDFSDEEILQIKALQKQVFVSQINLAKAHNKPLILHVREANGDTFEILKANAPYPNAAVLHCFNASKLLLKLKDEGFYFGIGGVLTFKNAKNLVEILPDIPLDRILIETDSPYLAPTPNRGKRNEPSYTKFVAQKIGEILDLNVKEVEEITTNNAKKFYNFKE